MKDNLQTVSHAELMADVVGIRQSGVPCGLFNRRTEPGFVLDNGTVLLECEKDAQGRYIGGAGMDGMFLRTPERYEPVRGEKGQILAFCRVEPQSVLDKLRTPPRQDHNKAAPKKSAERER